MIPKLNDNDPNALMMNQSQFTTKNNGAANKGRLFRVGVLGAGHISQFHLRALIDNKNVKVVGIADLDKPRAETMSKLFGVPHVGKTIDDLLDMELDVIHVLTPPSNHANATIRALEQGCHVFVEKPLATSIEDCDRIIKAGNVAKRLIGVDHSLLRDPILYKAISIVESGAIGRVLGADFLWSSTVPPYIGGSLPPHLSEGGYPFRDLGIHALYVLEAILGQIQQVNSAEFENGGQPNLLYDDWRVIVQCVKGMGTISLSWNIKPLQHIVTIFGTEGTIRADLFSLSVTVRKKTRLPVFLERVVNGMKESVSQLTQIPVNIVRILTKRIRRYHGLQKSVSDFYQGLSNGKSITVSADEARQVVYWTEAVAEKADQAKKDFLASLSQPVSARILITGATGFIGRRLLNRILKNGDRVRILVRRVPSQELRNHQQLEIVFGDLGNPEEVDRAMQGIETVYHLGAAVTGTDAEFKSGTVKGTENIVDAAIVHNVKEFIHISSLSVLNIAKTSSEIRIDETWDLEPHPEKRGKYTSSKLAAEQYVQNAAMMRGLPAVILRPGQVVGPGAEIIPSAMVRRLGHRLIVLGFGNNIIPLVYVEDLVDAIIATTQRDVFNGSVFHVVDPTELRLNDLVKAYSDAHKSRLRSLRIPLVLLLFAATGIQLLAKVFGRSVQLSPYRFRSALTSFRVDSMKAERQLGWNPRVGIIQGIVKTLAMERK